MGEAGKGSWGNRKGKAAAAPPIGGWLHFFQAAAAAAVVVVANRKGKGRQQLLPLLVGGCIFSIIVFYIWRLPVPVPVPVGTASCDITYNTRTAIG